MQLWTDSVCSDTSPGSDEVTPGGHQWGQRTAALCDALLNSRDCLGLFAASTSAVTNAARRVYFFMIDSLFYLFAFLCFNQLTKLSCVFAYKSDALTWIQRDVLVSSCVLGAIDSASLWHVRPCHVLMAGVNWSLVFVLISRGYILNLQYCLFDEVSHVNKQSSFKFLTAIKIDLNLVYIVTWWRFNIIYIN